jgi:anti-anti-sigma regulatory factor
MASLKIVREDRHGAITLRLEGTINGEAAAELEHQLNALDTNEIVLDFSLVREFMDAAVPTVLRAIESKSCHLQGMVRHHVRMFRYFGHKSPQVVERGFGAPEERILM